MPLNIINKSIIDMSCDAIVNPTDKYYSGGGGTDLAIHRAAGEKLRIACDYLDPLTPGGAVSTPAFDLKCRYVIHTVGPVWTGGGRNETIILRSCYLNCLFEAHRLGLTSIAFPLIASGTFGFPKDKVLRIAIDAISDFLSTSDKDMMVYICVLDKDSFELSKEIALQEYLDSALNFTYENHVLYMRKADAADDIIDSDETDICCNHAPVCASMSDASMPAGKSDLSAWLKHQDESFALTLLKLIDEKGMDDVECYKKANVTRNTFYKIRNVAGYKPSKSTVLAFAIALELTLDETEQLLKTVGFSLSHSSTADMIVEFYIRNGIYDIYEINSALYKYDQVLLGC